MARIGALCRGESVTDEQRRPPSYSQQRAKRTFCNAHSSLPLVYAPALKTHAGELEERCRRSVANTSSAPWANWPETCTVCPASWLTSDQTQSILPQRYVRPVGSAHVGLSKTRARRAVAQDPRAARKGISPWKARLGQNLREARNRTNYAQALNLRRALVQALTSEEHLDHLSVQVVDRGPVAQPNRFCEFRVPPLEFSLEPLYDLGMLRCEVLALPHVL